MRRKPTIAASRGTLQYLALHERTAAPDRPRFAGTTATGEALQRGRQLGRDLSLMHMATAGDRSASRRGGIAFTHMAAPLDAIAREAVRLLMARIAERSW